MTETCNILPGCKGVPKFTLALKKDRVTKLWSAPLACSGCRKSLEREARAQGDSIRFFGLDASKREAEKRNANDKSLRACLADYATPKVKAELKVQSKAKVVAIR